MKALVVNDSRSHYGFVIEVERNRDGSFYDSASDLVYEARELQFQSISVPEWQAFRREAAKDILCALLSSEDFAYTGDGCNRSFVSRATLLADELISQLKSGKP